MSRSEKITLHEVAYEAIYSGNHHILVSPTGLYCANKITLKRGAHLEIMSGGAVKANIRLEDDSYIVLHPGASLCGQLEFKDSIITDLSDSLRGFFRFFDPVVVNGAFVSEGYEKLKASVLGSCIDAGSDLV